MRHLATRARSSRHVRHRSGADYRVEDGLLVSPRGEIAPVASMRRSLPHDLTNGLAAAALVLETGLGDVAGGRRRAGHVRRSAAPHRARRRSGWRVAWFNDSKATTPHAAAAAIGGFEHVVLIAGGRNKGLDLAPMADDPERIRAVVAIGEATGDVDDVFAAAGVPRHSGIVDGRSCRRRRGSCPPRRRRPAVAGLCQLRLVPDGGFEARGDDFRSRVMAHVARRTSGVSR